MPRIRADGGLGRLAARTSLPCSSHSPITAAGSNAAANTADEGTQLLRRSLVWISLPRAATAARRESLPGGSASARATVESTPPPEELCPGVAPWVVSSAAAA